MCVCLQWIGQSRQKKWPSLVHASLVFKTTALIVRVNWINALSSVGTGIKHRTVLKSLLSNFGRCKKVWRRPNTPVWYFRSSYQLSPKKRISYSHWRTAGWLNDGELETRHYLKLSIADRICSIERLWSFFGVGQFTLTICGCSAGRWNHAKST